MVSVLSAAATAYTWRQVQSAPSAATVLQRVIMQYKQERPRSCEAALPGLPEALASAYLR